MVTRAVSDRCRTGVRPESDTRLTPVRHPSDTAAKHRSTRRLQLRAFPWRAALQELDEQRADPLRLLLLDPVPGAVDEMRAGHVRARRLLHPLQRARILIRAPVAAAGDEHRRLIDRSA